jgi:ribosomal-protein-alanine N-acetyltransferase
MTVGDAAAIANLHKRCFSQPWTEEDFTRFAEAEECHGIVARRGVTITGFIVISVADTEAEVLTLAVDTPWRRHGIASTVLTQAMVDAAERGAEALFLEVGVHNGAARALYKRLGFIRAGRRSNYYTTPDGHEDALVMKRSLLIGLPGRVIAERMERLVARSSG